MTPAPRPLISNVRGTSECDARFRAPCCISPTSPPNPSGQPHQFLSPDHKYGQDGWGRSLTDSDLGGQAMQMGLLLEPMLGVEGLAKVLSVSRRTIERLRA